MFCIGMAGAVRSAGEKKSFSVIMSSLGRRAVSMFLPTSDAYVFCAMTPFTGARR